jgi:hypothetical protein
MLSHGYCIRSHLGRIWTDSLVHDEDALMLLIKKMGVDRIMLGSDYPFPRKLNQSRVKMSFFQLLYYETKVNH